MCVFVEKLYEAQLIIVVKYFIYILKHVGRIYGQFNESMVIFFSSNCPVIIIIIKCIYLSLTVQKTTFKHIFI